MITIIANQKGGTGKTTHCVNFANYLALNRKREVLVVDMDFQGSIIAQWEKDKELFKNQIIYEVMAVDLDDWGEKVRNTFASLKADVIIDLPGRLDNSNLQDLYLNASLVICPFAYDKVTFESTFVFANVIKKINPNVKIVFLPNRLKAGVKYRLKVEIDKVLSEFGTISPVVSDRIEIQRFNTISLSDDLQEILSPVYDFIFNKFFK